MSRRELRIDDARRIAETPAVLVLSTRHNYHAEPLFKVGEFGVYTAHEYADRHRLMLPRVGPSPLSFRHHPIMLPPVELDRQEFARATRATRYDRRQEARKGGRRNARSVPIERLWSAYVFAEQGTDARAVEHAAEACAALVVRSWRHGRAEDWARRALALRQRAERKKAKKS